MLGAEAVEIDLEYLDNVLMPDLTRVEHGLDMFHQDFELGLTSLVNGLDVDLFDHLAPVLRIQHHDGLILEDNLLQNLLQGSLIASLVLRGHLEMNQIQEVLNSWNEQVRMTLGVLLVHHVDVVDVSFFLSQIVYKQEAIELLQSNKLLF